MAHLLRLELTKFKLGRNIAIAIVAIIFSILFITISHVDSMTDPEQTKDTFESTFLVIGLLMSFIFLVYSSVLTSRLVIGEYNQKTITILFSYPLNRKLLIASKLVLVMIYTGLSMLAGYICCCGYIIAVDRAFNMLGGSFHISLLRTWIPMAISCIVVCVILSLWPFIVGMIRKSVPMTIVTSLLVIVLRQVLITRNASNRESLVQVLMIAAVTAVFLGITFKKKILELY